ncbi:histidine ammonia-lyase [Alicyclobacillus sp.]|uniref:histidine ammonia-lyase n=1 Tax=Alicyclobacillus sp. TaxID=61169 RepID=UPI0025BB2E81|nr:histidine ammonia-lyase [Alicyclobacillus sp.]MCL6516139.1 histidine ammonia-lyase [Alicyclobacillus sp.]
MCETDPSGVPVVQVGGREVGLSDVTDVAWRGARVVLDARAIAAMARAAGMVTDLVRAGRVVYGVNTGFGKLAAVRLDGEETEALQVNLLRSHACGVGPPFPEDVVRAMMFLRLVSVARGNSGIRPETAEALTACLNAGIHPVVPQQGSLGASGDLAPLAHLALVLIGEGEAVFQGERLPGAEALRRAGIRPVRLGPKEGLALINGTQAMTAVGVLAFQRARWVAEAADAAAALSVEALLGLIDPFAAPIHRLRGHPEQAEVAARLMRYLAGSGLAGWSASEDTTRPGPEASSKRGSRVQDAYSLRCVPQVHGASWRALHHVGETLAIEVNAVTDNPLLLPDEGRVLSGGNFHGQPVALAMDYLKIAVSEMANISERRTERLLNPQLSEGLPPFLARRPGLESGLMILQYVAASLVSENKVLAHPASVDSIPSSANQEDHVSMGTIAARQAAQVVENAARVVAIELICAAEALEWRDQARLSPFGHELKRWVRERVGRYERDRAYAKEVEALAQALLTGALNRHLRALARDGAE